MISDSHALDATIKPLTLTSVSCYACERPDQQPHFLLLYSVTAAALKHPMLQSFQVEPARFMYTCIMLSVSALPKRVRRKPAIQRAGEEGLGQSPRSGHLPNSSTKAGDGRQSDFAHWVVLARGVWPFGSSFFCRSRL